MNSLLIAQNLVKRSMRNRKEIVTLLLLPILVVSLLSMVISNTQTKTSKIGWVDLDQSPLSTQLKNDLTAQNSLSIEILNQENFQDALTEAKVEAVVVIPAHFSSDILNGEKIGLAVYEGEASPTAQILKQKLNSSLITFYASAGLSREISRNTGSNQSIVFDSLLSKAASEKNSVVYRTVGDEEDQRQALTSSIGFTLVFMMLLIFSTMGSIQEDKKRLTLARIYSSPVKEREIITGILLGSLTLGTIQLIPLTLVLSYVFQLSWGLPLLQLFVTLFSFLIATIGLGIGLSGLFKNNFDPTIIIATIIVPTSILGGCFIPDYMLPEILNKVGYAVPQKWVMSSIQQLFSQNTWDTILLNAGIILMFGLAFATFGLKTIKPLND